MNGLLCIYKEENMTSFDALRTIKRVFRTKKVGHSGTLDPNATGVLVVAINRATKSLSYRSASSTSILGRLALYSSDIAWRKVGDLVSKHTAIWVG